MSPDALARALPAARHAAHAPAAPGGSRPPGPVGPAGPAGRRPRGTPPAAARDPRLALVHAFAALWLEVEAGRRSPAQLAWLMDARLVVRLADRWRPAGDRVPGRVRRVSGAQTGPGRYDAVAVVQRGERAGALALRLVRDADGWKVSEVLRPEADAGPAARAAPPGGSLPGLSAGRQAGHADGRPLP